MNAETIIGIARQFAYVREAQTVGQNRGLRVEGIQKWADGQAGDSWCAEFVWFVLDVAFQGKCPIPRTGSCQAILDFATQHLKVTSQPQVGDLFLYVDQNNHAHHIGIVTSTTPLIGIAGNTSPDGRSSNGDGVYEHAIAARIFVRYL
jgi:hypothetical protein